MSVIEVKPIDQRPVEELSVSVANATQALVVVKSQKDYEFAADQLKVIKAMAKTIEEKRKSLTTPIDAAKKAVQALFMPMLAKLETAERNLKDGMTEYFNEQERIRLAAEEKLRKEAEAKAEKERKALEEKAKKAELSGKTEKAAELAQQAASVQVNAPTLAPTVTTPQGVSYRDQWVAVVVDPNILPREYMTINQTALDKVAQAMKGTLPIPGVKYECKKVLSSRS